MVKSIKYAHNVTSDKLCDAFWGHTRHIFCAMRSTLPTMSLGSRVCHWGTVASRLAPEPYMWPMMGGRSPVMLSKAAGMFNLSASAWPPTKPQSTRAKSGLNCCRKATLDQGLCIEKLRMYVRSKIATKHASQGMHHKHGRSTYCKHASHQYVTHAWFMTDMHTVLSAKAP